MRIKVLPCSYDSNSVSLFDADRRNDFGEMYCVAPAISITEVPIYWHEYSESEKVN